MTVEQRIDKRITDKKIVAEHMRFWEWEGHPLFTKVMWRPGPTAMLIEDVLEETKNADTAECLTSSSEYIRECKKFLENYPKYNYIKEMIKIRKSRYVSMHKFKFNERLEIRRKPDVMLLEPAIVVTLIFFYCLFLILF